MYDKLYIAKQAAQLAVSVAVSRVVKNALTSVTDLDDDSITVIVVGTMSGVYASYKLRDNTDALVETAAAKYEEYKQNKITAQQA